MIKGLLLLTQSGVREGYGIQGKPVVAEATMTLQQPEACHVFSWESCPWVTGPWWWRAAQAPGVEGGVCG